MHSDLDIYAYLITISTYGTWLHGDKRGSVDDEHKEPGRPFAPPSRKREWANRESMKHPEYRLDAKARGVVDRTIREVCDHRKWILVELYVRTNHVHIVVKSFDAGEKVRNDLKAWCTRRLREAGCLGKEAPAWTEGGSVRKLTTGKSYHRAISYVRDEQGGDLPME